MVVKSNGGSKSNDTRKNTNKNTSANKSKSVNSSTKQAGNVTDTNGLDTQAVIRAVGVGGGGCNAINRMVESGVKGVDFIAINTDNQALLLNNAPTRVRIGDKVTRGLGAGADPEVGAKAAEESIDEIAGLLRGTDLLFITAGMGGGTGTGAAPIIAQSAQDMGILTIAVVTKPFRFEGARRTINAERGIEELSKYVDALIIVPNDKLLDIADEDTTVDQAFAMSDHVLRYGITGISDLVAVPGLINLDMADVRRVLTGAGICHMGIGRAQGPDRVEDAIDEAIHSPLLDTSIDGAEKIIINFTGSDMKLREVSEATSLVRDSAAPDADIIIGAVLDEDLDDEIMITLIASGFSEDSYADEQVNMYETNDDFRPMGSKSSASRNENPDVRQSRVRQEADNYRQSRPSDDYRAERNTSRNRSRSNPAPQQERNQDRDDQSGFYRANLGANEGGRDRQQRSNQRSNNNNSGKILPWLFDEE